MKASDLDAIQARCDRAFNPTARVVVETGLPGGGDQLLRVSEPVWQFYLAARSDVPALLAEVTRLKGLVEAAYREGEVDGYYNRRVSSQWLVTGWDSSDAKRLLDGP